MNLIEPLLRWNRWGSATLPPGRPREVVARIRPFLQTKEVVALVGTRGAGKSTVMHQLMDALGALGVAPEQLLHVNFEEPGFAPELGTELLDRILATWREEVAPEGRGYLFLDEVQVVPGWERWVRARNETEGLKIFVTGSSARLLSRELGTLFTGRHVSFRVHPLGFAEFLRFRGVAAPRQARVLESASMQRALREYVQWGGFPEVVLATDEERKRLLLKQLFEDVLYRDVAMRHEVRDLPTLRALAVHLLGETGHLVSFQKLANRLGVSPVQIRGYCDHLQEAMLVDLLAIQSPKLAVRARNPQKVFAVDTGLRNAVCLSTSADLGSLAETVAFGALDRAGHDGLSYWRNGNEVDLLVRRGERIVRGVQVAWELADETTVARELAGLEAFAERFPKARRELVVQRWHVRRELPRGTKAVPLWRFLLDAEA